MQDGTFVVTVKAVHPALAAATHKILVEIIGGSQTTTAVTAANAPPADSLESLLM